MTDNDEKRSAKRGTRYAILIGLIIAFGIFVANKPATTAAPKGVVVANPSIGGTLGCVNLNERALTAGATGRIYDLSDPDKCVGIPNGTLVVEQKHWRNAACVVPAGASPPCLWVMMSELAYPRDYQPPSSLERPRLFPSTTPAPANLVREPDVRNPQVPVLDSDATAEWWNTLFYYDQFCESLGLGFPSAYIQAMTMPPEIARPTLKRVGDFYNSVGPQRFCKITQQRIAANHQ